MNMQLLFKSDFIWKNISSSRITKLINLGMIDISVYHTLVHSGNYFYV